MSADEEHDPWTPVEGVGPPAERLELDDLGVLAEVTHRIRSRIIRRLRNPRTVAQLAEELAVPVTRLYHHMNHLEELGLIRVVATRKVAAVTERRYQVAATKFGVSDDLFGSEDPTALSAALGSLFDAAKLDLQREVESGHFSSTQKDSVLSMGEITLSHARRLELIERLTDLVSEFVSDAEDDEPSAQRVTLFVSAIPHSG